jgi:hypothetical protein
MIRSQELSSPWSKNTLAKWIIHAHNFLLLQSDPFYVIAHNILIIDRLS